MVLSTCNMIWGMVWFQKWYRSWIGERYRVGLIIIKWGIFYGFSMWDYEWDWWGEGIEGLGGWRGTFQD